MYAPTTDRLAPTKHQPTRLDGRLRRLEQSTDTVHKETRNLPRGELLDPAAARAETREGEECAQPLCQCQGFGEAQTDVGRVRVQRTRHGDKGLEHSLHQQVGMQSYTEGAAHQMAHRSYCRLFLRRAAQRGGDPPPRICLERRSLHEESKKVFQILSMFTTLRGCGIAG